MMWTLKTVKVTALSALLLGGLAVLPGGAFAQNAPNTIMEPVVAPGNGMTATPAAASAQQPTEDERRQEQLFIALDETYQRHMRLADPENPPVKPQEVGSLLYTVWEHMLIDEWRKGATTAAPLPGEAAGTQSRPQGIRELSLSGIVYASPDDWTVWLNGQRLKPDALPREVMDINVRKQYVELEWYDSSTNLIYPVRLRPHQRFNLDSRIFLPGTTTAAN